MLPIIAVYLCDLSKVGLTRAHILNPAPVEAETLSRQLEAVRFRDAVTKIGQELVSGFAVTLADCVRRNQLRVSINGDERPGIPKFIGIVGANIALFLGHERPNFIALS